MAGLGETILNTLKFAAGGEGEVQQRVLNKQAIDANQLVLDKQRDKQVAGLLDGTGMAQFVERGDPSDRSQALVTFDVVNAYNKNPEAVTEFLNTVPKSLLNATDEKGNTIKVKIKGIKPVLVEDQEMFAVEVVRPDGKVAPLTRRGTSSPDDNVILMSRDDLNGLATDRATSMLNNGAFDNSSTFLRSMTDLQDAIGMENARKEQALRDEVGRMLETDPNFGVAEKRELFELFSKLEGDELLQAVADMGIDIDAVLEGYSADRAAEAEGAEGEGAGGAEGEESREDFVMTRREAEKNIFNNVGGKLNSIGSRLLEAGGDAVGRTKGVLGAPLSAPDEPVADAPPRDPNAPTLSDVKDRVEGVTPAKAPGTFDPGANNSFMDAVNKGIAAISPQIEALRKRATGAAPVDSKQSTISPEIMDAPPQVQEAILGEGLSFEERRQAILDALETNLAKPTGKMTEYVADYMISNGFTTPESLSNAPSAEVMNIAFTIAANADVATTADRLNIAQSLLNFAQFGNTETSAKDVADLQIKAAAEARQRQEAADKAQGEQTAKAEEAYQEAATRADSIRMMISTKPRMFWQKNPLPREAIQEFSVIMNRAQNERSPERREAYQRVAGEIMPEVLAAFIISEPRADITEAITGSFQDLWLRAPYRKLDTDSGDFRITYKNNDGKTPEFLFLVTPKGDDAEGGQINMLQLRGMFGREKADYIIQMIEKTGELKNEQK